MSIKFIYFDIGGVLMNWQGVFSTAATKFGVTPEMISNVFENYDEEITKGKMTSEQFWEKCVDKLKLTNAHNYDFLSSWVADYKPIPETHALVKSLVPDYRIGLISNIYKRMRPLLVSNGVIPNVNYHSIIFSCDVGMRKPEMGIYEYAQGKTGVKPEEILFIDDNPAYLVTPSNLGWKTVHFKEDNPVDSIKTIKAAIYG